MKLLKSLVGLAAVASVIPFAVEKKEDGKSFTAKALLWKVDYNAATEEKEGEVNVNILGDFVEGVKNVAGKVVNAIRSDDEAVECECEEAEEAEETCECESECEADEAESEEVSAD